MENDKRKKERGENRKQTNRNERIRDENITVVSKCPPIGYIFMTSASGC